jgi:hypothetical protein
MLLPEQPELEVSEAEAIAVTLVYSFAGTYGPDRGRVEATKIGLDFTIKYGRWLEENQRPGECDVVSTR